MSEQSTNKLLATITNTTIEQLTEQVLSFHNELVELPKLNVAKLSERIFTEMFLPFFGGEVTIEAQPTVLVDWISVAGSPNAEVAIVDAAGNELFRVPAIFNTDIIDSGINNGTLFRNIFEEYNLRNSVLPAMGKNYILKALEDKLPQIERKSEKIAVDTERWNEIFKRYGKKPTTINTINEETTEEDFIEYD